MVTLASKLVTAEVGVKTDYRECNGMSQMATTGSITGGTDQLVVDDVMDLRVGDWIVVETGGEAGLGVRGTRGVGGAHPELYYANATARDADTSQANGTKAWLEDTGDVWYWNSAGSAWVQVETTRYYYTKAIPKALWAEILDIDGTTLTLSRNAEATATDANVYFDNWGIINDLIESRSTTTLPAGTFYVSDSFYISSRTGHVLGGAGKTATLLKTPKGASTGGLKYNNSPSCTIKNLSFDMNFRLTRYSFRWSNGRAAVEGGFGPTLGETEFVFAEHHGHGVLFTGSDNGVARNVHIDNPITCIVGTNNSDNVWAYNCSTRIYDPFMTYMQWMFNWATATGGGCEDCEVDSDWMCSGWEPFGSTNVSYIRCTSRNGGISVNAASGTAFTNMVIEVEDDCVYPDSSWSLGNPLININMNTSPTGDLSGAAPTTITNPTITIGRSNSAGRRIQGIQLNGKSAPLILTGTYDSDFVTPKGLINFTAPWDDTNAYDGVAMNINGNGGLQGAVTISGMRFRGEPPSGFQHVYALNSASVTMTNNVMDDGTTITEPVSETGTLDNAAFDALHPGLP